MRTVDYHEFIDTARSVFKKMDKNAVMVANKNIKSYLANFIISDGVNIIAADYFCSYFFVRDGEDEMQFEPQTNYAVDRVYSLGLRFLKKHTFTVGLNDEINNLIPCNFQEKQLC